MAIQILSNLNYPVGDIINQELRNANLARMAVAFLKYSGLKVIEQSLAVCLKNNGNIEIITGLDFKTTDPQSMHYLIHLQKQEQNLKFYCYGDTNKNKTNIVFHPKIYLFEKNQETTGIVGSTNLTRGGLLTNFEVNVIIKETKPVYFSQLEAIYNSVKFTDSIFSPDENYLIGYSDVYKAFLKNEAKAMKDKGVQRVLDQIKEQEEFLPGTVPTMRQLIIEAIKEFSKNTNEYVELKKIGDCVEKKIKDKNINFNMKNFRANLRKTIYFDLVGFDNKYNKQLFETKEKYSGLFRLTQNGLNFIGREIVKT